MQKLNWLLLLMLFIVAGISFVACHEDDFPNIEKTAAVTFRGRIMDENGNAVPNAAVKAGDKSTTTDKNGVFILEETAQAANHAIISVYAADFFEFSRAYVVKDGSAQNLSIRLIKKALKGQLQAVSGAEISLGQNAPKLIFPANAVATSDGNAYTGPVYVYAHYLDPKDPELGMSMPGNLTGISLTGEQRSLSTYGMLVVELEGGAGQKLNVAPGKEVEIHMPIDASIVAGAPAEVPLWHYDVEKAYWMEEGSAQKTGSEYVGKVKHFSYWNYDGSLPSIVLSGKVYLGDVSHPLAGIQISVATNDNTLGWACGHGTSDANGDFGGMVSKDQPLFMQAYWYNPACGNIIVYSGQIGPFSSDATLPPIIVPTSSVEPVSASGRAVDCNGQPMANAYVKVKIGWWSDFGFVGPDGKFSQTVIKCSGGSPSGEVVAYDLNNQLESDPVNFTFPPNNFDAGDIPICNTLSEYIKYSLDGAPEVLKIAPIGGLDVGTTLISSEDSLQNNYIHFSFSNNGQTGVFPIYYIFVNQFYCDVPGNTLTTNVSSYGPNIGDPIIGTFGGSFQDYLGGNHTITGQYKVKRGW